MLKQSWVTPLGSGEGGTGVLTRCFLKLRIAFCTGRFLLTGGRRRKIMVLGWVMSARNLLVAALALMKPLGVNW